MDHSELGEPLNSFRYKFIEPQEHDLVLRVLEKYLYSAKSPIGYQPNTAEDWNGFFSEMMKKWTDMSYIAVHIETGEIAACRMMEMAEQGIPSGLDTDVPPYFKHKSNIDMFKLLNNFGKDLNLFEKYGVNRYADMFGLCVDEKYRYSGVAEQMYRRGLNYLQRRSIKIVKCSFITAYTRRAGHENGYTELRRQYFHDCKNDEGQILNPDSDPTNFMCVGVFDLRDREIK